MADCIEKILIFTVGLILWACGILLITFGSIALASPETIINLLSMIDGVSNVTNIFNVMPLFEGVSIFMIVLGCFLFLVGCSGGVVLCKKQLRFGYIACMAGAMVTEICLIVYAAIYPGTMDGWIKEQMYTTMLDFKSVDINTNGDITYANVTNYPVANGWENLQFQTQCCGAYAPNDFMNFTHWNKVYDIDINNDPTTYTVTFPPSCCKVHEAYAGQAPTNVDEHLVGYKECFIATTAEGLYVSDQTCSDVVMSMVWQFNYISIIICSCLIVVELIGILLSALYAKKDRH